MKRRAGYQRRSGRGSGGGQVRIVAGTFGGRRLRVAKAPGLRPTPERTRETLFNWLQGMLRDVRVLDLFAGTGALAFEALSRGAARAVLVERHRSALEALQTVAEELAPGRTRVVAGDALAWLRRAPDEGPFDLVFVDPPFAENLAAEALAALGASGLLAAGAHLYVEWPSSAPAPFAGDNWRLLRQTSTGDSTGALLVFARTEPEVATTGARGSG